MASYYGQVYVDETFAEIKSFDPDSYQRLELDQSKKSVIIKSIQDLILSESQLASRLGENFERECETLSEKALAAKLGLNDEDVERIKHGLDMCTFVVEVDKSKRLVSFTFPGENTPFETVKLDSQVNIDYAYYMQLASIIIEGILLVLSIIGLKVSISKQVIKKASKELVSELTSSSAFRQAVKKFLETWKQSGSSWFTKAKALFYVLKDTYSLGILWNVIKTLLSSMSWWDWIKASALIAAQLIAAFATGGVALIAKIVLALKSAYDFVKKIANLITLAEIRGDID